MSSDTASANLFIEQTSDFDADGDKNFYSYIGINYNVEEADRKGLYPVSTSNYTDWWIIDGYELDTNASGKITTGIYRPSTYAAISPGSTGTILMATEQREHSTRLTMC